MQQSQSVVGPGASRREVMKLAAAGVLGAAAAPALARASGRAAVRGGQEAPAGRLPAGVPGGSLKVKVGAIEAYLVADGHLAMPLASTFAANADDGGAAARAELAKRFLPEEGPAPVGLTALLIKAPGATLLVDTGMGDGAGPTTGRLVSHLEALGVKPGDLDAVVITHNHFDHTGGLAGPLSGAWLGGVKVLMTRAERDFWASGPALEKCLAPAEFKRSLIERGGKMIADLGARLEAVPMDHRLAEGVRLVAMPGHTPGHVGVSIESGGEQLLFFADMLHVAQLHLPRPDWFAIVDTDGPEAVATRKQWLARMAGDRLRVAGTHLPFPGVGRVRAEGAGYAFEPVVWTF